MDLLLTNKSDGKQIVVNSNDVKIWEMNPDGVSTDVVFGVDMVRVVTESLAIIIATLNPAKPH